MTCFLISYFREAGKRHVLPGHELALSVGVVHLLGLEEPGDGHGVDAHAVADEDDDVLGHVVVEFLRFQHPLDVLFGLFVPIRLALKVIFEITLVFKRKIIWNLTFIFEEYALCLRRERVRKVEDDAQDERDFRQEHCDL